MKKSIVGLMAAVVILYACEKKVEPIDTYNVSVDFKNSGAKVLTTDVELNPKDSFYLDFTINSQEDMSYVEIQKNGVRIDTFRLNNFSNKKSFSLIKGYRADSAAGSYTYRVLGRDAGAVFMGDGNKKITVTVKPDFNFWSYRILQVPDTTAKTNRCYYSTTDGKTYSYSEGAANSPSIDFGYYYDTTGTAAGGTNILAHSIYALNVPQPRLSFYDINTWTNNATIFKVISTDFVRNLTSSGAINTIIKNGMTTGTASKISKIAAGNVIGFKTVSGKYGAILVRYINQNNPNKETQIEVDVKVQK